MEPPPRFHRERYLSTTHLHPALAAIGESRQRRAREGLEAHSHDVFEICLIDGGTVDWWAGDAVTSVPPGSIYLTKPGEIHGTVNAVMQPCRLCWLQIDPEKLGQPSLSARLSGVEGPVFPGAESLQPWFDRLLAEVRTASADSPPMLHGLLLCLLTELLRVLDHAEVRPANRLFEKARRILEEEAGAIPVASLAEACGISRGRLHEVFVTEAGRGPKRFLLESRLRAAAEKLAEPGRTITEVAFDAGFSSSQHFATAFRAFYGMSPREFRRRRFL